MKPFQKLFTAILTGSALLFASNAAFCAVTITDVPKGYWAQGAITQAVSRNYLDAEGGKFRPNQPITRAEFANAIHGVIQRNSSINKNAFSDVKAGEPYGKSILTLNQLQIIFGYPDGTFKPDEKLKRSEASSVVANIVRSELYKPSVLNKFKDKEDVPNWAAPSYISNVINDIYVNYPRENELLPNDYLTRAEAAVLALKLKHAIEVQKMAYLPEDVKRAMEEEKARKEKVVPIYVGTDNLGEFEYAYKNTVNLYDTRKIIEAGNLVPVKSLQKLNAKTVEEGQELTYVSPKDIYSIQGTKLYDAGTKFSGYVDRTSKSYWLKRQNKAYIVFNKATLNDGTEFSIAGVLYSMYNGKVVLEKKKNTKKVKNDATKQYSKRNAALKFTDKLVPVIKYSEDGKDNLFMLITGDMIIPESSTL